MQYKNDSDLVQISFFQNTNKETLFQGVLGSYDDEPTFSIIVAGLLGEEAAQFMFHLTNDFESAIRQYSIHINPRDMDKFSKSPYRGIPMSVGDLVEVDNYYDLHSFLCLPMGWQELKKEPIL